MGGFRARGRRQSVADEIVENAKAAADAGSFAIVVEGVAADLADLVTEAVDIPTIGIGASANCDGQILVTPDMLGLFDRVPKFVKKYADQRSDVEAAAKAYAEEVKARSFPGEGQLYTFKSGSDG
jgi:3-methyl-2-oxobutanoate hydroxymethyltransferase